MKINYKIPLVLSATVLGLNVYTDTIYAESSDKYESTLKVDESIDQDYLEIFGSLNLNRNINNYEMLSDKLIEYDWIEKDEELENSENEVHHPFSIRIREKELIHNETEITLIFRNLHKQENIAAYTLTFNVNTEEYEFTEILDSIEIEDDKANQVLISVENNESLNNEDKELSDSIVVEIDNISYIQTQDTVPVKDTTLDDQNTNEMVSEESGIQNKETDLNEIEKDSKDVERELDNNDIVTDDTSLTDVSSNENLDDKMSTDKTEDKQEQSLQSSLSTVSVSSSIISRVSNFSTPNNAFTGSNYTLTATASPSNASLYKFWIRDDAKNEWTVLRDYSSESSFNWKPTKSGKTRLVVHVKHKNSNKDYDDYKFVDLNVQKPIFSIQSFSSVVNGFVGKPSLLSTSVSGANEELFKYWVQDLSNGSWQVLRNYSIHSDFEWIPKKAGKYKLVVHAKDRSSTKSYDDYAFRYVTVKEPELKITNLNVIEAGHAGLPYTLSTKANATNASQYKYWIQDLSTNKWEVIRNYSRTSEFNWIPEKAGDYKIVVHAKDEASQNEYDDYRFNYVTVKKPKLSINQLSISGSGPAGSQYSVKSSSVGSENPVYKFWVQDDSTKKWEVIKDYSSESQVNWMPKKGGKYKIVVHSKDSQSKLDYDDYTFRNIEIKPSTSQINQFYVTEGKQIGSTYKVNVSSKSDNESLHKFFVQSKATNTWTTIKDWSTSTEVNWTPEKPGKYRLVAHSKDKYSQSTHDDYKFKDVTVHAPFVYQTTQYDINFTDALNKQMTYSPQTDLYGGGFKNAKIEDVSYYLNPKNFLDKSYNYSPSDSMKVKITTDVLNVRSGPSANYSRINSVLKDKVYNVVSEQYGWYKIDLGRTTGWISGDYVTVINSEQVIENVSLYGRVNTSTLNVRKGPSTNYGIVTQVYNRNSFAILDESNGWYLLNLKDSQGWVSGDFINVSSSIPETMLQFISLSNSSGIKVDVMNKELNNKGILHNTGQAFIDASKEFNVNEIYLLSHALLETGHGTSKLATGVVVSEVDGKAVTPKKVYNMFGIAAFDDSALKSGSEHAYKKGWDTPEKAIKGGAEWIAAEYINNPTHRQDTLYKMRWNPVNPTRHQYATDIGWAVKQTHTLDFLLDFSLRNNLVLKFDIPVYN